MRIGIGALLLFISSFLGAQEGHTFTRADGSLFGIFELHQITPGAGIRDANSRGGWGGQLGIEVQEGRFVLEAGGFPAQFDQSNGVSSTNEVFTLGLGFDYLIRLTDRRDGSLYLLLGIHLDSWSGRSESTQGRESDNASHIGFRMGAGLRLGHVFGEIRYRMTEGDIRVSSAYPGRGGTWGAVEVGMGVRF